MKKVSLSTLLTALALLATPALALQAAKALPEGILPNGSVTRALANSEVPHADLTFTVTEVLPLPPVTQGSALRVKVTNRGKAPIALDGNLLRAQDDQGQTYWAGLTDQQLEQGTVQPGGTLQGLVGFEHPEDRQITRIFLVKR